MRALLLILSVAAPLLVAPPARAQATAEEFRLGLAIIEQVLKFIEQMDPEAKRMLGGFVCTMIEASNPEMSPALKELATRTCADLKAPKRDDRLKPEAERTKSS